MDKLKYISLYSLTLGFIIVISGLTNNKKRQKLSILAKIALSLLTYICMALYCISKIWLYIGQSRGIDFFFEVVSVILILVTISMVFYPNIKTLIGTFRNIKNHT
jgi:uncharacterized membrane protein